MALLRTFLIPIALAIFVAAPLGGQEASAPAEAPAGLVLPGDQVQLRIEREPEMTGVFVVDADGEVVLPRLGTVRVARIPAIALKDTLRAAYAEYLRNPSVEVQVLRRIAVQGEVVRPGLYLVDLTKTVRDVIVEAGGVTEAGHTHQVNIVRGDEVVRLTGDEAAVFSTAELVSGDRVVIPRRHWLARNPIGFMSSVAYTVGFLYMLRDLVRRE